MSEIELLKQRIINAENDIKALSNKLDSWRNEANNIITEIKQNYINLNGDFIRLGSYIKEAITPEKTSKGIMIPSLFGTTENMEKTNKELERIPISAIPDDLMKRIENMKSVPMKKPSDSCWNCGKHGITCMNQARDTSEPCEQWTPRPKPPESDVVWDKEQLDESKKNDIIVKCDGCKFDIPSPINGCAKHKESGAKIGELVKCRSITGSPFHKDFYKKKKEKTNRDRGIFSSR